MCVDIGEGLRSLGTSALVTLFNLEGDGILCAKGKQTRTFGFRYMLLERFLEISSIKRERYVFPIYFIAYLLCFVFCRRKILVFVLIRFGIDSLVPFTFYVLSHWSFFSNQYKILTVVLQTRLASYSSVQQLLHEVRSQM